MENPIKMDDLGVPLFLETPKCILYPKLDDQIGSIDTVLSLFPHKGRKFPYCTYFVMAMGRTFLQTGQNVVSEWKERVNLKLLILLLLIQLLPSH